MQSKHSHKKLEWAQRAGWGDEVAGNGEGNGTCHKHAWRATGSNDRWVQWPAVNNQIVSQSRRFLGQCKKEMNI